MFRFGLMVVIGSLSVFGADRYFIGTGTVDFNTVGNWDAGGVPGMGDVVFFNNAAFTNLLFSADAQNTAAVFSGVRTNLLNTGALTWRLNQKAIIASGETPSVRFNGGKYVFGGLISTNMDETGLGGGKFDFANGELTTFGDVYLSAATNGFATNMSPVAIGGYNNSDSFVWNITNGTVYIRTFGDLNTADGRDNNFLIGNRTANSKTILNLRGPNTILTNNNWTHVGRGGGVSQRDCVLNISEGAKMYNAGALYVGWRGTGCRLLVNGTNSLLANGMSLTVAKNSAGGTGNRAYITTGGVVRCTTVGIQEGDAPADYESGGKIVVAGPGARLEASGQISIGGSGLRADMQILDGGEVWTSNSIQMGVNANGALHRLIIDGVGSRFKSTGSGVYFQGVTNKIVVRNGGALEFPAAKFNVSKDGYEAIVSDPGSSLISSGLTASGDALIVITNGATALFTGGIDMGYTSGKTTRLILDGVGTVASNTLSAGTPYIRLGCMDTALIDFSIRNGAQFIWAETNSTWGVTLGNNSTGMARVVVESGGVFRYTGRNNGTDASVNVGQMGPSSFLVRNGGQALFNAGGLNVGMVDYAAGSVLDASTNGFLDSGSATIRVYGYAGNRISVNDSVWQLAKSNPTVTLDAGSSGVGFTNSVLSFRNCSGVNILDNKTTGRFSTFAWGGENTFRLNAATNTAQSYVFGHTGDATDYVNLELFNGAKFNGNVTVNAGRLGLQGTNTIGGDLTLNTGASLALSDVSPLTVGGALSVAADTITVTLSSAPQVNAPQTVITAGSIAAFPAQKVVQEFGGKSYEITISAVGNRIVAGYYTGTVIRLY